MAGIIGNEFSETGRPIRLLSTKFIENHEEGGNLFDAVCGIFYAIDKGAKVVNASWVFYWDPTTVDPAHPNPGIPVLNEAIVWVGINRILISTSAGNDNMTFLLLP